MAEFRKRLSQLRNEKGLTQEAFANEMGLKLRSIQSYEYGERFPDFKGLIRLADYFEVSLDYLVGRSDLRERR